MKSVVVTTGARLHFGLLAHQLLAHGLMAQGQPAGREFGGIGLMVDRPGFVVRAAAAPVNDRGHASGDEFVCGTWRERVENLLAGLRSNATSSVVSKPLRLEILQAPPAHAGLGSGTQLGMAVAKALAVLAGENDVSAVELARRAGRGLRSALGLHGFEHGGLLVEAGQRGPGDISPLVARAVFPEHWRIVLARPAGATGVSGTDELHGFARLAPMQQTITDRLCRIVLMEILPAVYEHDFAKASNSIGQFGRLVGEYFAPVQGGVFAHERMRQLAAALAARGIHGFGQSSWGPTLFILCPDAEFASRLVGDLTSDPAGAACEFTIAGPCNHGAQVCVIEE